jgi:hypothetical protein
MKCIGGEGAFKNPVGADLDPASTRVRPDDDERRATGLSGEGQKVTVDAGGVFVEEQS